MNTKLFTVLSGDMVRSRQLSQRNDFYREFNLVLKSINDEFNNEFYAPLTVTKGIDEISAVLNRPDKSYLIGRTLNNKIYPQFFRFAIVTDVLDVALNTHDARQMDGKAFHIASDLLLSNKNKQQPYYFQVKATANELNSLLEELANLIHLIRMNWTLKEHRTIQLYSDIKNQAKVANQLRITQQAVSDSLKKSHYKDLLKAEQAIDALLKTTISKK